MHPSRKLTKFQQCQAFSNRDGRIQQGKRLVSAHQGGISVAADGVFGSYCSTKDRASRESQKQEAINHSLLSRLRKGSAQSRTPVSLSFALIHSRPATENNNNANLHFVVL